MTLEIRRHGADALKLNSQDVFLFACYYSVMVMVCFNGLVVIAYLGIANASAQHE